MSTRQLDQMRKAAVKRGWRILKTNRGHWKWIWKTGAFFFTASTPSDHRAIKNIESHIRRAERGLLINR